VERDELGENVMLPLRLFTPLPSASACAQRARWKLALVGLDGAFRPACRPN
jgi:ABC-type transporter Mla maintaining outer membrane lipid asymmetry ATPase subunit MlaF